jgi:transposase
MSGDLFWLTNAPFQPSPPHLPADTRGKTRVDDCRVICGIVHELKAGGRWVDARAIYGSRKTLYNCFAR